MFSTCKFSVWILSLKSFLPYKREMLQNRVKPNLVRSVLVSLTLLTADAVIPPPCSFESGMLCTWVQMHNDNFDWKIRQGHTPSLDTGPMADHTYQNASGHYIYLETSQKNYGEKVRIKSAFFTPSMTTVCKVRSSCWRDRKSSSRNGTLARFVVFNALSQVCL
ncbi:MAM and LDL-receptor class A domain-containing protein 1-like [Lingula anatina]|uniref:MAM and LDL-receptor class A domain-containing protein 1-like n=1 Tax=Lingula anatina TaxID=7574 RepID=A0A1S3HA10_LINAN|nr:MAM and LDL-receptor class A domain-containing protein 1-like [Lingula anatina]|eukprot:XP_013382843.1 MAM and LDL-receptor class A domain-containing protein 1-like [Lingula anatina]